MAEHGALAGGQDGRQPRGFAREHGMPDGVHAAVDRMQPAVTDAVADRVAADAQLE
jgi:hypothetical protein